MKVAVVGAGAIGAYIGAALHRAGAEVHLIASGPHLAAIRHDGVRVLSPRGVAALPVCAVHALADLLATTSSAGPVHAGE